MFLRVGWAGHASTESHSGNTGRQATHGSVRKGKGVVAWDDPRQDEEGAEGTDLRKRVPAPFLMSTQASRNPWGGSRSCTHCTELKKPRRFTRMAVCAPGRELIQHPGGKGRERHQPRAALCAHVLVKVADRSATEGWIVSDVDRDRHHPGFLTAPPVAYVAFIPRDESACQAHRQASIRAAAPVEQHADARGARLMP
jgi:hypothetical protein